MRDQIWPKRINEGGFEKPLRDHPQVRVIIDRLQELERETRPSGGGASSEDKDIKSREAIAWAGDLILHLVGWAIDHQQGLAIKGLKSAEQAVSCDLMSNPTFVNEKTALDSHENERVAVEANAQRARNLPPERQREFSAQMVELLGDYVFPNTLADALRALDYGEVQSILQKANVAGEKRNYTERISQLRALEFIEFEKAKGISKTMSREVVGNHFGYGVEAIKKWKKRVSEALGISYVTRALLRARKDGNLVRRTKMRLDANQYEILLENRYFDRMKKASDTYKKSLREKQNP
jgi:hypothetical protein